MMFGRVGNPGHDDCVRIVHQALDAGINVIDTADVYSCGEAEEIVGKALGADIGPLDVSYDPPAITRAALRRRPSGERAAA
jgi:diketogulonate reductase-like aldo/keto reductase